MMNDSVIDTVRRIIRFTPEQLDSLSELADAFRQPIASESTLTHTFFAYHPRQSESVQLFQQLLEACGLECKLPVDRFHVPANKRESLSLLTICDSPAYVAVPPREAQLRGRTSIDWRGLDLLEGLWLILSKPDIIVDHALDLIESTYSIECTPTIYQWRGQRFLSAICPDARDEMCRPAFVVASTSVPLAALQARTRIGALVDAHRSKSRLLPML